MGALVTGNAFGEHLVASLQGLNAGRKRMFIPIPNAD